MLKAIKGIEVLLENSVNLGFGTANNCGVKRAKGEFLFFLNPDCLLLNDAVSYFLTFFKTVMDAGVTGCYLVDANGEPNHYCGSFSGHEPKKFIVSEARQTLKSLKMAFGGHIRRDHLSSVSPRKIPATVTRSVDWLNGAALFMPRKVFLEVGGFDERFFLFSEEVDFQRQLAIRGYGRYVILGPRIAHLHKKGRLMSPAIRLHFYRGYLTYLNKYNSTLVFQYTRLCLIAIIVFTTILHFFTKEYSFVDDVRLISLVARFRQPIRNSLISRRLS